MKLIVLSSCLLICVLLICSGVELLNSVVVLWLKRVVLLSVEVLFNRFWFLRVCELK